MQKFPTYKYFVHEAWTNLNLSRIDVKMRTLLQVNRQVNRRYRRHHFSHDDCATTRCFATRRVTVRQRDTCECNQNRILKMAKFRIHWLIQIQGFISEFSSHIFFTKDFTEKILRKTYPCIWQNVPCILYLVIWTDAHQSVRWQEDQIFASD